MITHAFPNLLMLVAVAWLGLAMALLAAARQAAGKLNHWSTSVSWNH